MNRREIKEFLEAVMAAQETSSVFNTIASLAFRKGSRSLMPLEIYFERMQGVLASVVDALSDDTVLGPLGTMWLKPRHEGHICVLVMAGEQGLCGSFNTQVLTTATQFITSKISTGAQVIVHAIGKKAFSALTRKNMSVIKQSRILPTKISALASEIVEEAQEMYNQGSMDSLYVVFNRFISLAEQIPTIVQLVPIAPSLAVSRADNQERIYEPSAVEILDIILPTFWRTYVQYCLYNSYVSEQAARMVQTDAIDASAQRITKELMLVQNRLRQEIITAEL